MQELIKVTIRKPEGKRPLCGRKNNIKIDLK
jgi:hypothetical protein